MKTLRIILLILTMATVQCIGGGKDDITEGGTADDPNENPTTVFVPFSITGTVSGLTGTVVLQLQDGQEISLSSNLPFAEIKQIAENSLVKIKVKQHPLNQKCYLDNNAVAASGSVTSIAVTIHCGAITVGLDPNFGSSGALIQDFSTPTEFDQAHDIKVDQLDRFVVSGLMNSGGTLIAYVKRFKNDGTVDSNFANNGTFELPPYETGSFYRLRKIILNENNIYVIGDRFYDIGDKTYSIILRLNSNGTLDATFGNNGIFDYSLVTQDNSETYFGYLAISESEKIYIAAAILTNAVEDEYSILVFSLTSKGILETSFSGDGIFTYRNPNALTGDSDGAAGITFSSSGQLMIVGQSLNNKMFLGKLNVDGTLESSFGSGGFIYWDNPIGGSFSVCLQVVATGANYILGCAANNATEETEALIYKVSSGGVFDSTFANNVGYARLGNAAGGSADSFLRGIDIDEYDNIFAVGFSQNNTTKKDMFLWKLNSNGVADTNLGVNGVIIMAAGRTSDDHFFSGVAVDSQGRVYVAGSSGDVAAANSAIYRILP